VYLFCSHFDDGLIEAEDVLRRRWEALNDRYELCALQQRRQVLLEEIVKGLLVWGLPHTEGSVVAPHVRGAELDSFSNLSLEECGETGCHLLHDDYVFFWLPLVYGYECRHKSSPDIKVSGLSSKAF